MMLLILLLSLTAASANAAPAAPHPLEDWSSALNRFVDDEGRTDFKSLVKDDAALNRYVAWLADHGPNSTPSDFATAESVLAYHINAYNALAMAGVIERGIPRNFSSFFKRASFFRFREIIVDGDKTNLYDYENKVIRPLGDPRVHFALNCMVRSCPRLPRIPFQAETLDAVLEQLSREFFASENHLRLDQDRRRVAVSAILDFYTKDFASSGKAKDLIPYINRYRDEPIPVEFSVEFLDYNWQINQQP